MNLIFPHLTFLSPARLSFLFLPLIFAMVAGCDKGGERGGESIPVDPAAHRADIEAISKARIFFGHQSVGRNVLAGLADMSRAAGVPLRIVAVDEATAGPQPGLFQVDIGKNKEPLGKIEAYKKYVKAPQTPYDVAVLKFCYEDLSQEGMKDPQKLLEEYVRGVAEIRTAQPGLRVVHVTVPLRADPEGWKTSIKRLIGRATEEDADNQLRNTFNALLRKRFAGEPLFDIAEIESTLPDGKRSFFSVGGDTVYTLGQVYTTDGGHLNEMGRARAAAKFAAVIAASLGGAVTGVHG